MDSLLKENLSGTVLESGEEEEVKINPKGPPKQEHKDSPLTKFFEGFSENLFSKDLYIKSLEFSSERSIVALAITETKEELMMKFTPLSTSDDNSFEVEKIIYEDIIPNMLDRTPHFARYHSSCTFRNFKSNMEKLSKAENSNFKELAKEFVENLNNIENLKEDVNVLITYKMKGKKLGDWFSTHKYNTEFTDQERYIFDRDVALQVAHTLEVMKEKGMVHNDLHLDNIFVEEKEKEEILPYLLNNKIYKSRFFAKIFDFDRSYVLDRLENSLLTNELAREFGQCNLYMEKRDWFTFLDCYCTETPTTFLKKVFPLHILFPFTEQFGTKGRRPYRGAPYILNKDLFPKAILVRAYLDTTIAPKDFIKSIEL